MMMQLQREGAKRWKQGNLQRKGTVYFPMRSLVAVLGEAISIPAMLVLYGVVGVKVGRKVWGPITHVQLLRRDEATVVLVEVLEGVVHDLLAVQLAQVDRGCDELLVVDQLVAVDVD